jgi:hypothetical protein
MCDALFIGADRELALIQYEAEKTPLHIMNISETEKTVLDKIKKPYVYYIGAYEGCGCGFHYGITEKEYGKEFVEPDEEIKGRQSVETLFQYLSSELKTGEEFILFNSWEGEFDQPVAKETTINLNTFQPPPSFQFENHERIRIIKQ